MVCDIVGLKWFILIINFDIIVCELVFNFVLLMVGWLLGLVVVGLFVLM